MRFGAGRSSAGSTGDGCQVTFLLHGLVVDISFVLSYNKISKREFMKVVLLKSQTKYKSRCLLINAR